MISFVCLINYLYMCYNVKAFQKVDTDYQRIHTPTFCCTYSNDNVIFVFYLTDGRFKER